MFFILRFTILITVFLIVLSFIIANLCFVTAGSHQIILNDDSQQQQQQQQDQEEASASFTAALPTDRTICDQLGARLDQNELDSENSILYPASMRIRKGVIRQSAESRSLTPMYIAFSISNQTFYDEMFDVIEQEEAVNNTLLTNNDAAIFNLLDARIAADSIAATLGIQLAQSTNTKNANATSPLVRYWQALLPATANALRPAPNFDVSFERLLTALVQSGLSVFSDKTSLNNQYDGINTLNSHLTLSRLPVIRFAACRSNATDFYSKESNYTSANNTIPWPLVTGYPYERFAFVVGVDLDNVYVVVPSLAEDALAVPRPEFLERWHHTEKQYYWDSETKSLKEQLVMMQRQVAAVFKPAASSEGAIEQSSILFQGIIRQMNKPPRAVEFDGFC